MTSSKDYKRYVARLKLELLFRTRSLNAIRKKIAWLKKRRWSLTKKANLIHHYGKLRKAEIRFIAVHSTILRLELSGRWQDFDVRLQKPLRVMAWKDEQPNTSRAERMKIWREYNSSMHKASTENKEALQARLKELFRKEKFESLNTHIDMVITKSNRSFEHIQSLEDLLSSLRRIHGASVFEKEEREQLHMCCLRVQSKLIDLRAAEDRENALPLLPRLIVRFTRSFRTNPLPITVLRNLFTKSNGEISKRFKSLEKDPFKQETDPFKQEKASQGKSNDSKTEFDYDVMREACAAIEFIQESIRELSSLIERGYYFVDPAIFLEQKKSWELVVQLCICAENMFNDAHTAFIFHISSLSKANSDNDNSDYTDIKKLLLRLRHSVAEIQQDTNALIVAERKFPSAALSPFVERVKQTNSQMAETGGVFKSLYESVERLEPETRTERLIKAGHRLDLNSLSEIDRSSEIASTLDKLNEPLKVLVSVLLDLETQCFSQVETRTSSNESTVNSNDVPLLTSNRKAIHDALSILLLEEQILRNHLNQLLEKDYANIELWQKRVLIAQKVDDSNLQKQAQRRLQIHREHVDNIHNRIYSTGLTIGAELHTARAVVERIEKNCGLSHVQVLNDSSSTFALTLFDRVLLLAQSLKAFLEEEQESKV